MYKCIVLLYVFSYVCAQPMDMYFQLLEQGRIQEVRDQLLELQSRYPADPAVDYLAIIVETDGDTTVARLRRFIKQYPKSAYTDDAEMKIGDYLYARGLYSQAGQQLKKIPIKYGHSEHLQRAMDMLVVSFIATGEVDSARHYVTWFKKQYPQLEVDHYGKGPQFGNIMLKNFTLQLRNTMDITLDPEARPWIVQLGAFSKYPNAKRLEEMIKGYSIDIVEVNSNGKRLHTVRVVRYATEQEAEAVGHKIKETYGVNYRVLKRP